jgi:4-alpha-glucanotransferase
LLPGPALSGPQPPFAVDRVDFQTARTWKDRLLRASFDHFTGRAPAPLQEAFELFCHAPENADWLSDWALFSAIKARRHPQQWSRWPEGLRRRDPEAIETATVELSEEIRFQKYAQFLFFRQWEQVRARARSLGIAIMGDLPIYVVHDSADVWVHPELFDLDPDGEPRAVAGVPPDAFSDTGQLWGYPLYRWDRMEAEGYRWWIGRFAANFRLADMVRIDHFRGFAAYWAVPATEATAVQGLWREGPGEKLFSAVRAALGEVNVVAEDLGTITPDVEALLTLLGIPGMKVLQFAFSEDDNIYLPHRHLPNAVVYTGTHDNDTSRGWYASLRPEEKRRVFEYLGSDGRSIAWDLIRAAYASVASLAIVPLQDVFELGSEARMNNPGLESGNWRWRAVPGQFLPERAARLKRMAELTGRIPRGGTS